MLAVGVADVAPPARPRREADLERRVDALKAAEHALVLRPAQPVANELEELRRDGALGRALVGVRRKAHVLSRRERAPVLDAIVPVVGDGAEVTRCEMLACVGGELRGDDEGRDARAERRRREPACILPSIELSQRPFADEELGRGLDHRRVRVVVETSGDAEPPREQDGQRDLVELGRLPVRRAIERPVLIPAAVRALARL